MNKETKGEVSTVSQHSSNEMLAAVQYPSCMYCVHCERNVNWDGTIYHEKYECNVSVHKVSLSCPNTYSCNRFSSLHSS